MFVRMHTNAPEIKINLFDQIIRTYAASVTKTQGHPKKMKAGIFLFLQDAHSQFISKPEPCPHKEVSWK